jgi:hypothetical protein
MKGFFSEGLLEFILTVIFFAGFVAVYFLSEYWLRLLVMAVRQIGFLIGVPIAARYRPLLMYVFCFMLGCLISGISLILWPRYAFPDANVRLVGLVVLPVLLGFWWRHEVGAVWTGEMRTAKGYDTIAVFQLCVGISFVFGGLLTRYLGGV